MYVFVVFVFVFNRGLITVSPLIWLKKVTVRLPTTVLFTPRATFVSIGFHTVPDCTIVDAFLFCHRATQDSRGTRLRWLEHYGRCGGQDARWEKECVASENRSKRALNSHACYE